MPGEPKPPGAGEFADLDDDVEAKFRPGEYGRVMVTGLTDLVKNLVPAEKHDHVLGFLKWLPPEDLETWLVLTLEHGADLTRPKGRKTAPKGRRRRG